MANSRILQPLQAAAAPLPSGSFSLFNTISRRGVLAFLDHAGAPTKSNYFYFPFPFHKKPHWNIGCGKKRCHFPPLKKNLYDMESCTVTARWFKHTFSSRVITVISKPTCPVHTTLCQMTIKLRFFIDNLKHFVKTSCRSLYIALKWKVYFWSFDGEQWCSGG